MNLPRLGPRTKGAGFYLNKYFGLPKSTSKKKTTSKSCAEHAILASVSAVFYNICIIVIFLLVLDINRPMQSCCFVFSRVHVRVYVCMCVCLRVCLCLSVCVPVCL